MKYYFIRASFGSYLLFLQCPNFFRIGFCGLLLDLNYYQMHPDL